VASEQQTGAAFATTAPVLTRTMKVAGIMIQGDSGYHVALKHICKSPHSRAEMARRLLNEKRPQPGALAGAVVPEGTLGILGYAHLRDIRTADFTVLR